MTLYDNSNDDVISFHFSPSPSPTFSNLLLQAYSIFFASCVTSANRTRSTRGYAIFLFHLFYTPTHSLTFTLLFPYLYTHLHCFSFLLFQHLYIFIYCSISVLSWSFTYRSQLFLRSIYVACAYMLQYAPIVPIHSSNALIRTNMSTKAYSFYLNFLHSSFFSLTWREKEKNELCKNFI